MKEELLNRIENNHKYHNVTVLSKLDIVRATTKQCALELVEACPEGRELSLALTKIEEAMFWANAAIARGDA